MTYEDFFAVLPFENQAVVVECSAQQVVALMRRSINTCGEYGALIPGGLRVEFRRRDCSVEPGDDNHSELVSIQAHDGSVLYPLPEGASTSTYRVVTLDFLAKGGSGYEAFGDCRQVGSLGNLRQLLAHHFKDAHFEWGDAVDGRFRDLKPL